MTQRKVSPHTIASYRDTFRLLLQFAQKRLHKVPFSVGIGRSGCLFGRRIPGRSGKPPSQWRPKPEPPFDGHPVVLPLRLAGGAGAQRNHPTSVGDSEPTTTARPGGLSDPARDRGAAGGAESNEVAGTPRPRLSTHRRSDRPAIVRDDRVAARGCLARSRRTCALPGQRAEGTLYTLGQAHGRGSEKLDPGARQRRFQDAVSQHPRRTFECRWCSAPIGSPRSAGAENNAPLCARKESRPTCFVTPLPWSYYRPVWIER